MLSDKDRHAYDLAHIAVLCAWRTNPVTGKRQAFVFPPNERPPVVFDEADPLISETRNSYIVIPRWYGKNKELFENNELLDVIHINVSPIFVEETGHANPDS